MKHVFCDDGRSMVQQNEGGRWLLMNSPKIAELDHVSCCIGGDP